VSTARSSGCFTTKQESPLELQRVLEGLRGRLVAVGEYPQWLKDRPDVISAYVPDQDGTVKAVKNGATSPTRVQRAERGARGGRGRRSVNGEGVNECNRDCYAN
jgi:hypothetical protein